MKSVRIIAALALAVGAVWAGLVMVSQVYRRPLHYPYVVTVPSNSQAWLEATGERVDKLVFVWSVGLWLNGNRIIPPESEWSGFAAEDAVESGLRRVPAIARKHTEVGDWATAANWYFHRAVQLRRWIRTRTDEVRAGALSRDECIAMVQQQMHVPPYDEICDSQRGVEVTPTGFAVYSPLGGGMSSADQYEWASPYGDESWELRANKGAARAQADSLVRATVGRILELKTRGGVHFIGKAGQIQSYSDSQATVVRQYIDELERTRRVRADGPLPCQYANSIVAHLEDR